ncbi:uncharacterized protein LOC131238754 [Magnolia sinica]|uniref:uncharacterized protein LOC131238754 n=1 Tax=Magnolia sinica TaxID=86752 RepID=UPI002659D295|nr:uncharacterized protein LOC131238754 [Magnolia sinica]
MKRSGPLVASMAAASATAISIPSPSSSLNFSTNSKIQCSKEESVLGDDRDRSSSRDSSSTEKFAPRFDGLRFIETLITAHR